MAFASDYLLVAAIDFGTTYSGFAYSFYHDYKKDPTNITTQVWSGGQLCSHKTPSCVLFNPNGDFHSFGFMAEDRYADLEFEEFNKKDWFYFRHFKMNLYNNNNLTRNYLLKDITGKKMPAIKVFAAVIKYLKDGMFAQCSGHGISLKTSDIKWVLTVPAIWSDASKQFTREAAIEAGIDGQHLVLCLEPEAASVYCKQIPLDRKEDNVIDVFSAGTKYLVMDAGGGTIDVTVHEVQTDGLLNEVHMANGADWGGTKVDDAFVRMLQGIVGKDNYDEFCNENSIDMMDLFREFEIKKRALNPEIDAKVYIKMPSSLNQTCEEKCGANISQLLQRSEAYKDDISFVKDKLRISPSMLIKLFDEPLNEIKNIIERNRHDKCNNTIDNVLLVGGFSASPVFQQFLRINFPSLKLIFPQDPEMAVLKGAVIFGHSPKLFKARICRHTYGVDGTSVFILGEHKASYRYIDDQGTMRCKNIFSVYVHKEQVVGIGQTQKKCRCLPALHHQENISLAIYTSTEKSPTYVTEKGCNRIGILRIPIPKLSQGKDRSIVVQMTFGETELGVVATANGTGEHVEAKFDFL